MTCATAALAAILAAAALAFPFEAEIDSALSETADIYPVPKALVLAVISVESGFRPNAVSPAGARGLMQLMPYTARRVGIAETELLDPQRNILGGVRLLAVLLRHYEGDLVSALVAYNARPRRLLAPVPRNGETPRYVWKVLATLRRLSSSRVTERRAAAGPTYPVLLDAGLSRSSARGHLKDLETSGWRFVAERGTGGPRVTRTDRRGAGS